MNRGNSECRVYVGNLPTDIKAKELDDLFYKYGTIKDIMLKKDTRGGQPFAFIEFEDPRDAQDAIRGRDGYDLDGNQLRVESPRSGNSGGGGGSFRGRDQGFRGGRGGGRRFIPRGNGFRVLVKNLPPTGSWQDLKDHMREAGDVMFTDVFSDCTGVVEFARHEDMKRAVRILNDTKFRSHQNETSYVTVEEDETARAGRYSRSRSRSPPRHSRSRSFSPKRSRSPRRSYSRSRSRSRS